MTRPLRATSALACAALCAIQTTTAIAQALEPYEIPIWNGVYAGLHAGGNWLSSDFDPFISSSTQTGAFGGHIGAMTQFGALVAGVEADLDYKSADSRISGSGELLDGTPVSGTIRSSLSANGTVRGRLGVTLSPQLMIYATAGYAWATIDTSVDGLIDGTAIRGAAGTTLNGIAYGAGIEGFLSSNVMSRIEAMRIDYEDLRAGPTAFTPGMKAETSSDVIRAGISWKFN